MNLFDATIAAAEANGLAVKVGPSVKLPTSLRTKAVRMRPKSQQRELVEPAFCRDGSAAVWTIPLYVVAGDNSRTGLGSRTGRSGHEREAVCHCLARNLDALHPFAKSVQSGERVLIALTRIGGNRLDKWDNLPSAMKYVLDAVCLFLGVRDSSSAIEVRYDQHPGTRRHGVKVRIERL